MVGMVALAFAVFVLFFVAALVGIVIPVVPGVPLAAVGAVLAAWITGFDLIQGYQLVLVVLLAVAAQLLDVAAGAIGATVYGSRRAGLWGGILGSLVGLVLFPPFGFLLGALVGAVAAELITGRVLSEALRSGVGALLGTLGGVVAKLFIVVAIGVIVFPRFF